MLILEMIQAGKTPAVLSEATLEHGVVDGHYAWLEGYPETKTWEETREDAISDVLFNLNVATAGLVGCACVSLAH
jgi:hypothetical protein